MFYIGCHLSSAKGFLAMGKDAEKIGATVEIGPVDAAVFPHGTAVRLSIPEARLREAH